MTRHVRTLAATVCAGLVLSACSGSGDEAATSTAGSAASGSSSGPTASPTTGGAGASTPTGAPAYGAGAGAFTSQVAQRLGRSSLPDKEIRGPGGSTGTWKGTPVGVLTKGQDITLVVRDKGKPTWRIVGGWWPSKGLPGPYLGGKRHLLMLGSDARPGQRVDRSRADAIQVVGLDGKGGGGVLGIPRDTEAALATGGRGKINAAMARGGPQAQVSTVSRLTKLPIQGYLLTGFQGFSKTVTAMGGVEVTLKRPLRHLKPGTQRLYGPDLLWVARERKSLPGGDLDRSSNQGLVLVSVLSQLRAQGVGKLPGLMTKTQQHFLTDLRPDEVLTLLASGYALNPSRVGRQLVPSAPAGSGVALKPAAQQTFARFADGNL